MRSSKLINADYKKYISDVKNGMLDVLKYQSEIVQNIINYIPLGGKMVRSMLLFAITKLCNDESDYKTSVDFGIVIELLHLATLVHDDVIDSADKRRGVKSINAESSNRIAILAGDLLFSNSFKLMSFIPNSTEAIRIISLACEKLVCGEIEEEILINSFDITIEQYLDIVDKKTASLFEVGCKIGTIITNSNEELIRNAGDFGRNIGIAFQIMDDKIDYFSQEKQMGKKQYADLIAKKMTIPLILLKQECDQNELDILQSCINNQCEIDQEKTDAIINMMNKYNIENKLQNIAMSYISEAKECIMQFAKSDNRTEILSFIDNFCLRNK